MVRSRLGRYRDKQLINRSILSVLAVVGILGFLIFFGVKILAGFSFILDKMSGSQNINNQQQTSVILPPALDPLPEATNSAAFLITGSSQKEYDLIIYRNDSEVKEIKPEENGIFQTEIELESGSNIITAKAKDNKGNTSQSSNSVTINYITEEPELTVTEPADGSRFYSEQQTINIKGTTDPDNQLTLNGRMVIVQSSGSFTSAVTLNNGENKFNLVATNQAGNQTTVEMTLYYEQ